MQCTEVQPLFTDFADNTLSREELHALTDHLRICRTCTLEWREFQQTLSLVHSLETFPPPADLLPGIRAKLAKRGLFDRAWALIEALNFSLSIPVAAAIFTIAMLAGFLLKTSPLDRTGILQSPIAQVGALQQGEMFTSRQPTITPNAMFAVSHNEEPFDSNLAPLALTAMTTHLGPAKCPHRLLSPDIHVLLENIDHDGQIALCREMLRRNWQIRPITSNLILVYLPQADLRDFRALLGRLGHRRFVLMPAAAAETRFDSDKKVLTAALRFQ